MSIINIAEEYARKCHEETNHLYDGQPYSVHLDKVAENAWEFRRWIEGSLDDIEIVIAACWCHDVIEDTRQTYNDVVAAVNKDVADIVYAVTNEKGKNRKERASGKYYGEMRLVPNAVFVKYCDRLANIQYSKKTGSRMLDLYRKEHDLFVKVCPGPVSLREAIEKVLEA